MSAEAVAWGEESSDAELITAARGGDSNAFGALYERHAGAARTVARQYTRSSADADDVVSDAFARVYSIVRGGGGPDVAFRAYLFTVVRRLAHSRVEAGRRVHPTDDMATFESAFGAVEGVDDPALAGFERGVVARAYGSLPERWQAVLWYTEIERLQPAQVAPLLGLTANGVAALAYRAREGLREAYLQQHLVAAPSDGCRTVNGKLGAYVRGGLAKRETGLVRAHLETCEACRHLVLELGDVNHGLRGVIAPLVLGVAGLGALASPMPVGLLAAAGTATGAGTGTAGAATGAGTGAAGTGAAGTGAAGAAGTGAAGAGVAGTGAAGTGAAGTGAAGTGAAGAGAAGTGVGAAGSATAGGATVGAGTGGATAGGAVGGSALAGGAGSVATTTVAGSGAAGALGVSGSGVSSAVVGAGTQVLAGGAVVGSTAAGGVATGTTAGAVGAGSLTGATGAVTTGMGVAGSTAVGTAGAAAAGAATATGATALAGAGAASGVAAGLGGLIAALPGGMAGAVTAGVVGVSLAVGGAFVEPAQTRSSSSSTVSQGTTSTDGGPGGPVVGGVEPPSGRGAPDGGAGPLFSASPFVVPPSAGQPSPDGSPAAGPGADGAPASPGSPAAPPAEADPDPAPRGEVVLALGGAGSSVILVPGDLSGVSVTIVNSGESEATSLRAALVLPDGVELVGGTGGSDDGWQPCTDDASRFCLASLPSGASSLLSTSVRVGRDVPAGATTIGVEVTAAGVAPRTLSAPADVRAEAADLAVTGPDRATLTAGEAFPLSFTVANRGPGRARDVVASVALPAGVRWSGDVLGGAGWTCAADGSGATCRLPDLAVGSAELTVTVIADLGAVGASGPTAVLSVSEAGGSVGTHTVALDVVAPPEGPVDPEPEPVDPGPGPDPDPEPDPVDPGPDPVDPVDPVNPDPVDPVDPVTPVPGPGESPVPPAGDDDEIGPPIDPPAEP